MLKIRVSVDRKAALLAGRVMGETCDVDVSPEGMGEHWGNMVGALNMSENPPVLRSIYGAVDDATEGQVRLMFARAAEAHAEERRREEERLEGYCVAAEAALAAPMVEESVAVSRAESGEWLRGYITGLPFMQLMLVVSKQPYVSIYPLPGRIATAQRLDNERIDAENARRLADAKPRLDAEWSEKERVAREKSEAEAAAKAAGIAKRAAKRLETGHWERETGSYNERRYSSPWCARVSFANGPKAEYSFGDSTGKWGKEGLLRVECKPGDIIAWGQKDLRKPGNSDHTLLIMLENGRMRELDKTEAYREWQRQHAAPKA